MLPACETVCACKRRCALQGLQRRWSWEFERHGEAGNLRGVAPHLRNSIALQGNTPFARQRNGIGLQADTFHRKAWREKTRFYVPARVKHYTRISRTAWLTPPVPVH